MVTKSEAKEANIDWDMVERLTEVPRTYLVTDRYGREFFKMYTPHEAARIFREEGWTGQIVSTLNRKGSGKKS